MLLEFQQALADLVASPDFCRQARADPQELMRRYDLSAREHRRLVDMVNQPGMALNCMLYRSNRLAPLAQNLYGLCNALGARKWLLPSMTRTSCLNHITVTCISADQVDEHMTCLPSEAIMAANNNRGNAP